MADPDNPHPAREPDWLPPYREYTESERQEILGFINRWEHVLGEIRRHIPHSAPTGEDLSFVNWNTYFSPQVRIRKIFDTVGDEYSGSMDRGEDSSRYRHILYSILDPDNQYENILLVSVKTPYPGFAPSEIIVTSEKSYYIFRAIMTGVWENRYQMHLFVSHYSGNRIPWTRGQGNELWFRLHMSRYAILLIERIDEAFRMWYGFMDDSQMVPQTRIWTHNWLPGSSWGNVARRLAYLMRARTIDRNMERLVDSNFHHPPQPADRFHLNDSPGSQSAYMVQWHASDRIWRIASIGVSLDTWVYIFSVINDQFDTNKIVVVIARRIQDVANDEPYYRFYSAIGHVYSMTRTLVTGIWDDVNSQIYMSPNFPLSFVSLPNNARTILETFESGLLDFLNWLNNQPDASNDDASDDDSPSYVPAFNIVTTRFSPAAGRVSVGN